VAQLSPEPAEDTDAVAEPTRRLLANIERVVVGKPDEVALVVAASISGRPCSSRTFPAGLAVRQRPNERRVTTDPLSEG